MKQRLLLALLMLFTSVGFVMGQDSHERDIAITIPAGGSVNIQLTGTGLSKAGDSPGSVDITCPTLETSSGTQISPTVTAVGAAVQWKYPEDGVTTGAETIYFVNNDDNNGDNWSGLQLTIDGKVEAFVVGASGDMSSKLAYLAFTNNGVLETLTLGNESNELGYVSALRTLSCQDNKLAHIPAKGSISSYIIGTQSPDGFQPVTGITREEDNTVKIDASDLTSLGLFSKNLESFKLDNWTLNGEPITATPGKDNTYTITDSHGNYISGTFYCQLTCQNGDANYPNVLIQNVPITIPEAEFTLEYSVTTVSGSSTDGGSIIVKNADGEEITSNANTLHKDDQITIEVKVNEGYYIYEVNRSNLNLITPMPSGEVTAGTYEYTIAGTGHPEFHITFAKRTDEADIARVINSAQGTMQLCNSSDELVTSNSVTAGTQLYVKVKPETGYLVNAITVNGNALTVSSETPDQDGWYKTNNYTTVADINTFVALFDVGSTVNIPSTIEGTDGNVTVTYNSGASVKSGETTLTPGTSISIIVPAASDGYEVASVLFNGKQIGTTAKTYTEEVEEGTNYIYVEYRSTKVTELNKLIFGIDDSKVKIYADADCTQEVTTANISTTLKSGDDIYVKITGLAADESVERVVINGEEAASTSEGTYFLTEGAVAGINSVVVYATGAPTLNIVLEGLEQSEQSVAVTIKKGDNVIADPSAETFAEGDEITITTNKVQDKAVSSVTINGVSQNIAADGIYTFKMVAGTNYVTIVYESTKPDEEVAVEHNDGGEVSAMIEDNTIVITTTPKTGYGVAAVIVNDNDWVETVEANGSYEATARPGENKVSVVFTDKALVDTRVDGVTGSSSDIVVLGEDGVTTIKKNETTLDQNNPDENTITIKVNNQKEHYKLVSVSVNGKPLIGEEGSGEDAGKMIYTYDVKVGTNLVVATYESTAAERVEEVIAGDVSATISYYSDSEGTTTVDPSTLDAEEAIYFKVTPNGNETVREVYFNDEGPLAPSDGVYTGTMQAGKNTLYVFFNDAAIIRASYAEEDGTITLKNGSTPVNSGDELAKDESVTATITPSDGYVIKAVYVNGINQSVTPDKDGTATVTTTVQSGLNIIHAEFEYVAATVNLTYNSSIGSVTTSPELDPEEGNTEYEAGEAITIIPSVDAEDYNRITVTINGSTEGVTNNGNGTYTVTLQAGVNNIHVDFARALAGNLLVKYPDTEVSDVTIYDLNGNDVATTVLNGDWVEAPADTKLEVTFKVTDPTNKLISAVVNGQLYSLTPDAKNECRIGSSGTTDDIVILPEGESVLRIYVKKLVEPSITPVTTYAYDGTAKAVEYTTSPAGLNNIEVYYRPVGGAEWRTEPYAEAGSYKVMFKRAADANYAEVNTETSPTTITINKAHLIITQLPTVTRDEATNKYVLAQDGKAGYYVNGSLKSVAGTFELEHFTHESGEHYAEVGFTTNEEDDNLDRNTITGIKVHYNVKSYTGGHYTLTVDNSGTPFYLMCGDAIIDSNDLLDPSASIAALYDPQPGFEYALYQVKDGEETLVPTGSNGKFLVSNICNSSNTSATLKLKATDKRQVLAVKDGKFEIEDAVYNGQPQFFNPSSVALVVGEDKKAVASNNQAYGRLIVTYKDAKGNTVIAPVDAGTYTVTLSYNDDDMYKDFKPVSATFEIEKVNLDDVLIGDPVATPITAGQSLRNSHLAGPAEIPGQYQWLDETAIPTSDSDGGTNQPAKFVPVDKTNFTSYRNVGKVNVKILKGVQVVTYNANLGTISVVDDQNISYKSGSQVQPETKLTITAKPLDATMQQFESMTITIGEETKTYTTSTATITFPEAGEGNVEIYATFKLKEKDPVIIEEGQYAVVLPESVRGAKVDKSGVYAVERGDDFTFTVTTLAADAGKVTVTVNGSALTGTNGKYTLTNVTERQDISISVSNPTEVKVNIPRSYHIEGQSEDYATVSVINNTANDGHYYFNDALTVIAFTHITGVDFARWSDNSREQVHEVVLDAAEYTLLASFTGLPTGIEDIESATVYTGKGFIMVKNVADAELTVVSISGRLQAKQEISGDTRIDVPQGIYVVVLQSGDEVKQLKVIVK